MGPISPWVLYSPSGSPLRLSSLTEDTWMISVSSCGVKLQEVLSGLEKERLKHWRYTCTFVAFLNITIPEDEIRYKKCVDILSEHNQFCSAILHFWSAINFFFANAHTCEGVPRNCRVCNSKYEPTSMNDLMRSVKHLTQVLIVGVYCVDQSRKFADGDVM